MTFPVAITFRGMAPSAALETTVQTCAAKLAPLHDRISGCEIVVEVPHRHQRQGRHFHVRLTVMIPGDDIVVGRDSGHDDTRDDAHAAVRAAFDTARRALIDRLDRSRTAAIDAGRHA